MNKLTSEQIEAVMSVFKDYYYTAGHGSDCFVMGKCQCEFNELRTALESVGGEGEELLPMPNPDFEGNWKDDYKFENGNYMNQCFSCKKSFIGLKYRTICKLCYDSFPDEFNLTPKIPE